MLKVVGDGSYGTVFKAVNKQTGETVAIKQMKRKFASWDECLRLRELKSLRKLSHPNIVKLKEVVRENEDLYFIFEFADRNVNQLMKCNPDLFTDQRIRSFLYQALSGLAYTHKNGFFHRDVKPENLLIQGEERLKIADFGLARETHSRTPFTDYVSTRWYRAPEVLLRSTDYGAPIDIFGLGVVMAELYLRKPVFPGCDEFDQVMRLCSVLGTPSRQEWPEGYRLAAEVNFSFPDCRPADLHKLFPAAPPEALDLIRQMLRFDPAKRPTAVECMEHRYFNEIANRSGDMSAPVEGDLSARRNVREMAEHWLRKQVAQSRRLSMNPPSRCGRADPDVEECVQDSDPNPFLPKIASMSKVVCRATACMDKDSTRRASDGLDYTSNHPIKLAHLRSKDATTFAAGCITRRKKVLSHCPHSKELHAVENNGTKKLPELELERHMHNSSVLGLTQNVPLKHGDAIKHAAFHNAPFILPSKYGGVKAVGFNSVVPVK